VAALWCKPIKVIATARKPEELKDLSANHGDSIRAVKLNATFPADVEKAVATAVSSEGSRHERAGLVPIFGNTMTYFKSRIGDVV
jgi:NADP-dependent 3-hydroxy acid dehydrogenase YdfG